jgi:histidinol-phosphatase (PHP family)
MRSWVNYHSHTNYCDGALPPVDYTLEAIRLGLPAYGYSSHAPVDFETVWCMPRANLENYLSDINAIREKYEKDLQVYLGLEIDYFPGIAKSRKDIIREIPLDYYIGSVHFVGSFDNGEPWNIDTSYELFQRGIKEIFHSDIKKAAIRFWELTRQMIEQYRPDVIGHIDKIKMHNAEGNFFNENEKWYKDQVKLTIDLLKDYDCKVEINTRGYYKYQKTDLYPSDWIIDLLHKSDIPLMISSDSHHPSEITKGMEYAASRLKALSIDKIFALYNHKWSEFEFSEEGILFS